VEYLADEHFFDPFTDELKARFVGAEITGQLFLRKFWDPIYTRDFLGFPPGASDQFLYFVTEM
jgi:hypothetical protein